MLPQYSLIKGTIMSKAVNTINETVAAIRDIARAEFMALESFEDRAQDRDATLCALVAQIDYTPGHAASEDAVAEWVAIRTEWVKAYQEAAGCAEDSAGRAFTRVVNRAGIVRPQSADALRKQAARDAKKGTADKGGKADPKAGAGDAAAKAVKLELSKIEVHLINMLRAGKFTQAAQVVADMATAAGK
jgi:uncharacterized protein (DUF2267 family)